MEAAKQVKVEGKKNDLIERIAPMKCLDLALTN